MVNPVPGHGISTPFGKRGPHWSCLKNSQGGIHTGADWAAPAGTPIVAPIAGTIRHRNYGSAFGPYQFAISPSAGQPFANGEVFFAHVLDRLPNGTEVQVGQRISRVGALGNATGPHLHMEYMPNSKGRWACGLHADPAPVVDHGGNAQPQPPKPQQWQFPNGHKVYAKYLKVDGHEQNADRQSNSIAALQEVLNRHSMPGGTTLPVTGKYWEGTDKEVRLCQRLHLPPEDPAMKSYVGPKQWQHLKEATGCPYEFVPDTAPSTPPPTTDRWVHGDAWRPAPSLVTLRDEVDASWPDRSRVSDGTIGDAAHSTSKSEHNPVGHKYGPEFGTVGTVHAMDITADGIDVQEVLDSVIGDLRVWYVIHDGSIWSKTHGWKKNPYNGSNPHTTHIHISLAADDQASAVANEKNTEPWLWDEVPQDPDPNGEYLTKAEFDQWRSDLADALDPDEED